jgi:dinuclear metal center YbgI/SA1388 family protein
MFMVTSVGKILKLIDQFAPFETASSWDNSGLLIGGESKPVDRILIALDVTESVVDEAIEEGVDLIITHHPLIFSGLKNITLENRIGKLVFKLIQNDIALISAHTNLDKSPQGISAYLSELYDLDDVSLLVSEGDDAGFGRIGNLKEPMTLNAFAEQTRMLFNNHVKIVDRSEGRMIRKIAISSGASSDFIDSAMNLGADVFLLGDLKYHEAQGVLNTPMTLIDIGHFESEFIYLDRLKELLEMRALDKNYDIYIKVSETEKPIFTLY